MKMNEPVGKAETIEFKLNGETISALAGETIIQAATRHGVDIPHLCYKEGMRPDGNCRACMVEIKGERVLAPSCCRQPAKGMEVRPTSQRALHSQKMVLELLLADAPKADLKPGANELARLGREARRRRARASRRARSRRATASHPAMTVNLDACIQCTRCVRACREEQVNDVIGYAFRGGESKIVFDFDDPMGESTCVACGECVQACPTGALAPAKDAYAIVADKTVDSVCPYCGVGCQLTYHVKDNRIVRVEGRDGPSNHERLCVKGRFGFDYVQHPQRLTKPLIRKAGAPKTRGLHRRSRRAGATCSARRRWEEALDLAASGLKRDPRHARPAGARRLRQRQGLERGGLSLPEAGAHRLRHEQRRPLHAPVPRLVGRRRCSRASARARCRTRCPTSPNAEVIFVIGANPTSNHPVAATWMKNAAERGAKLIVADPRRNDLARHAWRYLQFKADTDVALLNAMIYTIIEEGLVDEEFIRQRTTRLRGAQGEREGLQPRGDGADLRHPRGDDPRGRARLRDLEGLDHPVGHGHLAARARHRQRALPDRAHAHDRADRPARHGAASRCAARTTCRAPPTRG